MGKLIETGSSSVESDTDYAKIPTNLLTAVALETKLTSADAGADAGAIATSRRTVS